MVNYPRLYFYTAKVYNRYWDMVIRTCKLGNKPVINIAIYINVDRKEEALGDSIRRYSQNTVESGRSAHDPENRIASTAKKWHIKSTLHKAKQKGIFIRTNHFSIPCFFRPEQFGIALVCNMWHNVSIKSSAICKIRVIWMKNDS